MRRARTGSTARAKVALERFCFRASSGVVGDRSALAAWLERSMASPSVGTQAAVRRSPRGAPSEPSRLHIRTCSRCPSASPSRWVGAPPGGRGAAAGGGGGGACRKAPTPGLAGGRPRHGEEHPEMPRAASRGSTWRLCGLARPFVEGEQRPASPAGPGFRRAPRRPRASQRALPGATDRVRACSVERSPCLESAVAGERQLCRRCARSWYLDRRPAGAVT
jgi:hypothetical protein